MAYTMERLTGSRSGVVTNTAPLEIRYSCEAHEVQTHRLAIVTTAVSAGVNVGNPVTLTLHHSFDDGATWLALSGLESSSTLYAAGTITIGPGPATAIIGPLLKLTITPPTGQTITLDKVSKTHCVGHHPFIPRPPVAVTATIATTGVGFTVGGDAIVPTFGATTDAYALKTGGTSGTTLETLTITYTDATKAVIQHIVRT